MSYQPRNPAVIAAELAALMQSNSPALMFLPKAARDALNLSAEFMDSTVDQLANLHARLIAIERPTVNT
jgi:hypothetical protein